MRRAFGQTVFALLVLGAPSGAQSEPSRLSRILAIGVTQQDRDYRSPRGWAARVGVSRPFIDRLDWAADFSIERFGDGSGVFAPCRVDAQCPPSPDDFTLTQASALLVLRDTAGPGAYLLGGGGITRVMTSGRTSRRTYAHATAGMSWIFTRDGAGPFLELRFNNFLRAGEPMSSWSFPVSAGVRF